MKICFYIPDCDFEDKSLWQEFKELSKREGVTISALILAVIDDFFDRPSPSEVISKARKIKKMDGEQNERRP